MGVMWQLPKTTGMLAALLVLAASWALPASSDTRPPSPSADRETFVQRSETRMATRIEVTLPAGPDVEAHAATVFEVFRQAEFSANEWKEGSPLARVNRSAGGKPQPIPEDLWHLLHRGLELGALTDGAFDLTWAALWGLWDFNAVPPRVPTALEVEQRLELIDYRQVELNREERTVRLPREGMKLGVGGIAKGFALDRAAAALRARGISDFTLSAGGQVYVGGRRGNRPWRVGIRDPRGTPEDFFALIEVSDASVSTSGDYERYFLQDGVRYHHILDPRTGFPTRGLRSATVLSSDATLADALSTAFMVLGWEKAMALAHNIPGLEAVLVDDSARVFVTPGLEGRLQQRHRPRL